MNALTAAECDYQSLEFAVRSCAAQVAAPPAQHPVVIVGAGPVGLSLAIDLAQRGQRVLLLDEDFKLSSGSRAICFAKRTLEIFDRLGCGERMVAKGVSWSRGKVYFGDAAIFGFDLLAEPGYERPAFINLQQYYVEGYLAERALQLPNIEIRWKNKVVALAQEGDCAVLEVETADGNYRLQTHYVAACDGSRSTLRGLLGLSTQGRVFQDRFLIADVKMKADFPAERWFWFDPPFHRNQSVLLHRQPDNVWRIDFQLGPEADPDEEKKPENIVPRVRALLGADAPFELEWASVYTFSCRRMERFRHGRVFFVGDSAHGVSPFGARGANSGVQDAENLGWKLGAVLRGDAGDALLGTYASEREYAADENILHSTRATDFISPKSPVSRLFRDAVLDLARHYEFARKLVNSGRLSVPATLHASPLNTPDRDNFQGAMALGAVALDAPLVQTMQGVPRAQWLLRHLGGDFALVVYGEHWPAELADLPLRKLLVQPLPAGDEARADATMLHDAEGWFARRYDAQPGSAWLLRPDQHLCARWRHATAADVRAALACALARPSALTPGRTAACETEEA